MNAWIRSLLAMRMNDDELETLKTLRTFLDAVPSAYVVTVLCIHHTPTAGFGPLDPNIQNTAASSEATAPVATETATSVECAIASG